MYNKAASLEDGKAPWEWRWADMMLTFKGRNKEEPIIHRPMLQLVQPKTEKIQVKYMEQGILTKDQYGFNGERSCFKSTEFLFISD